MSHMRSLNRSRPTTTVSRRSLIAGAGATTALLALAACDETDGIGSDRSEDLTAVLSAYGRTDEDTSVWQVTYDLAEDQDTPETYSAVAQAARHAALEDKREEQEWGLDDPLLVIDPLGHAEPIIDTGDQIIHHDLDVVGDIAYALTTRAGNERVEDRIIRVDLSSGEVDEVVDLQTVFPEYEKLAHPRQDGFAGGTEATGKDWIHINSIHIVEGTMYLSARETSTVIALDDALEADSAPSVRWMIGVEGIWEGTGYEDLFLAPEGPVTGNAGQHSVVRLDDDALPAGQYYIEMYNNNHWYMGTRDEEVWSDVGPDSAHPGDYEGTSHILRYLIDESAGTYSEDLRVDVAYSSVVSNVQRIGGDSLENPMVVNSGKANVFTEHDAKGNLLATYRYDSANMAYRVYKDPFEGFWFSAA